MIEEQGGWFVKNVRDARWHANAVFGRACTFEEEGERFPETGLHLFVLQPDRPACYYHRENAQEDFVVLEGRVRAIVNDEERMLEPWDLLHCPAGVTHVLIGAGEGPSAVLAIGHRRPDHTLAYPVNDRAGRYDASTAKATDDPRVAYADVPPREIVRDAVWPLERS